MTKEIDDQFPKLSQSKQSFFLIYQTEVKGNHLQYDLTLQSLVAI